MGAGEPAFAERSAYSGITMGMVYSIVILVLFVTIPEPLVRLFHPSEFSAAFEEAVPLAVSMLRIAALYVLFEAIIAAIIGALRGAGDTHFTMVASVAAHWILVPILYVALNVLHLPIVIGWVLVVLFIIVFCGMFAARFRGGAWKHIKVINS
jgi:MATE family multidrug resistance protein